MKIEIKKEDIIPYVYFVCSMAQESQTGMHGALGSKSDFIGGIFDRWINIIPESLIFNKHILKQALLESKLSANVNVFSDFFKYAPAKVGIAPDVLGLKINNDIVPFVKFDENKEKGMCWIPQDGCPQIEVKSFKGKQYMVSLRDQGYRNKFLVMVAMDLSIDYLLPFFNENLFSENELKKLEMPDEFIISNEQGLLTQTQRIEFESENIGTLELLSITTAEDFMSTAIKCLAGESPRYIKNIFERKVLVKEASINKPISYFCEMQNSGLYRLSNNWKEIFNTPTVKTLDVYIENPDKIVVIKKAKTSITVQASVLAKINNYTLKPGKQYNIDFDVLARGDINGNIEVNQNNDQGSEYFIDKNLLSFATNKEKELINQLTNIIKKCR